MKRDFPRPSVAVDLVIFTIIDAELRILLVKRGEAPFKGEWALPGGFVRVQEGSKEQGEDLDDAARRELHEETGLDPSRVHIEQLYTFGRAGRDPRTRVIAVSYFALVRPDLAPLVNAGGDASHVQWFSLDALKKVKLAFDHAEIVETALNRIRGKLEYSDIAFDLVPMTFTIPELRQKIVRAIGRDDLMADVRYADFAGRDAHREELLGALYATFAGRTVEEWIAILEPAGVPCGRVNDVRSALRDPQAVAREVVRTIEHPSLGTVTHLASAVRVGERSRAMAPAPGLGEHTAQVLADLAGYDAARIAHLTD